MKPDIALSIAVITASAITQVYAATPAGAPPAALGTTTAPVGRGVRGGAGMGGLPAGPSVPTISATAPGMPDVPMPAPATARKPKWPIRDANNTPPAGYLARSQGDNGFYLRDAQGTKIFGTDFNTWAASGHFTNYDQSDIPPYTLPDPLTMQDGRKVTSADMWYKERRPELVNLFKDNIYGRVPEDKLPKIIWEVRQNDRTEATITKTVIGYFEGTTPEAAAGRGAGRAGACQFTRNKRKSQPCEELAFCENLESGRFATDQILVGALWG
jgi:hypothetical protein